MVKKSGEYFAENYRKCWSFLNECRWYMVFALGIFALMFLVGFIYPYFFRAEIFDFIARTIDMFEGRGVFEMIGLIFFNNIRAAFMAIVLGIGIGIFPLITGIINGYLIGFVAREAVVRDGLSVMWKLFPHGIFELPAIILSIGIGMKIGVFLTSGKNKRRGIFSFIIAILTFLFLSSILLSLSIASPYNSDGIGLAPPALPIIFISLIIGLYAGFLILPKEDKKIVLVYFRHNLKEGLRFFLFVVLPLLLIAGIVEGILIGILG